MEKQTDSKFHNAIQLSRVTAKAQRVSVIQNNGRNGVDGGLE